MVASRRVGNTTSKTRDHLLDAVEKLMITRGYAAVTYRAVASAAEATPSLVQYYFPTLDDIFVVAIRRRAVWNQQRLEAALASRGDDPLRAIWEFSREEATASLMTEFIALGNHRTSIQAEIAEVTEQVRQVQLDALRAKWGDDGPPGSGISTGALLFLLNGIPKMITLEAGVGVSTTHADVVEAFERYLAVLEPPAGSKDEKAAPRRRSRRGKA